MGEVPREQKMLKGHLPIINISPSILQDVPSSLRSGTATRVSLGDARDPPYRA
jgi:hypothetical protein